MISNNFRCVFDFRKIWNEKCFQSVDQREDDGRPAWVGEPGQHVLYERRPASFNPHADFARLFFAGKASKMCAGCDRFVHRLRDEVNLSGRTAVNRSLPVARRFHSFACKEFFSAESTNPMTPYRLLLLVWVC